MTLLFAAAMLAAGEARACAISVPAPIREAREADAVFVGSVTDYQLGYPISVEVSELISGEARGTVTVLWRRALNFGPPPKMEGDYLFAVDRLDGAPLTYVIKQRACSPPLVFERGSFEANAVRELFGLWPEPEAPQRRRTDAEFGPAGLIAGLLLLPVLLAGALVILRRKKRLRP